MTTIAPQCEPIVATVRQSRRFNRLGRVAKPRVSKDERTELVGVCPHCGRCITPGDQRESIERPQR